ncbi:hypothetical protein BDR26DRAFT_1016876 [Obelidium mucronatum]|nr:hypothetical protein BDR26DRAFT_1016876 [Obelidium mucronatum]
MSSKQIRKTQHSNKSFLQLPKRNRPLPVSQDVDMTQDEDTDCSTTDDENTSPSNQVGSLSKAQNNRPAGSSYPSSADASARNGNDIDVEASQQPDDFLSMITASQYQEIRRICHQICVRTTLFVHSLRGTVDDSAMVDRLWSILSLALMQPLHSVKETYKAIPSALPRMYKFEVQSFRSTILHDFQQIFQIRDPYNLHGNRDAPLQLIGKEQRFLYGEEDTEDGGKRRVLFMNPSFLSCAQRFVTMKSVSRALQLHLFVKKRAIHPLAVIVCMVRHLIDRVAHENLSLKSTSASAHVYHQLLQRAANQENNAAILYGVNAFYNAMSSHFRNELNPEEQYDFD